MVDFELETVDRVTAIALLGFVADRVYIEHRYFIDNARQYFFDFNVFEMAVYSLINLVSVNYKITLKLLHELNGKPGSLHSSPHRPWIAWAAFLLSMLLLNC